MADLMNFADVHDQLMELLTPRTVLSLLHAVPTGVIGAPGEPGIHGANGASLVDTTWTGLFGNNDQSSTPIVGITEPGGKTS